MSSPSAPATGYQLARRYHRGIVLGLNLVQTLLLAGSGAMLVLLPALTHTPAALTAAGLFACAGVSLALLPVQGRYLYQVAPGLTRFTLSALTGRHHWAAPQPVPAPESAPMPGAVKGPVSEPGPSGRSRPSRRGARLDSGAGMLPSCLRGVDLLQCPRPGWAEASPGPVAVIRDRRGQSLSVVLSVRGSGFSLLEESGQHAAMSAWGQVLNQFGRETSPVIRLGWSLWSASRAAINDPVMLPPSGSSSGSSSSGVNASVTSAVNAARASYRRLLAEERPGNRHELRVWISINTGRPPGGRADGRRGRWGDPLAQALAAAQSLSERCQGAGLAVGGPLSPAQIVQSVRRQAVGLAADPGPADQEGVDGSGEDLVDAGLGSVEAGWDAMRVDGCWHRSFWVAAWPTSIAYPQWLSSLLDPAGGVRAISTVYEPIPVRASRRRITADTVALDSQLQLRHKHDFRIPVDLHHAQGDIDQREAELGAGWCEYAHATLITLTAPTREHLEHDSHVLFNQAAQCGITSLRALNGHHDAAWTTTLPLALAPGRERLSGSHA